VTTLLGIALAGLGAWIMVRSSQSGLAPFLIAGGAVLVMAGIFLAGG
jgi:hypothetical protein